MNVPPYVISAVRQTESQLRWSAESMESLEDAVVRWVGSRLGKTISAATASKVQAAMDKLADAEDSYKEAKKALQIIVDLAGGDPNDAPNMGESGMTKKNLTKHGDVGNARSAADSVRCRAGQGLHDSTGNNRW